MQNCGHCWVKTAGKLSFIQKCPQFSQKMSASNACMLATLSMSGGAGVAVENHFHVKPNFC